MIIADIAWQAEVLVLLIGGALFSWMWFLQRHSYSSGPTLPSRDATRREDH